MNLLLVLSLVALFKERCFIRLSGSKTKMRDEYCSHAGSLELDHSIHKFYSRPIFP